MFGGKFDYGKEYAKYKPEQDTQFESYVDATPGLASVWDEIQSDPTGTQGSYWTPRGATSKAAFGRAHAAEDEALSGGTYRGGTDVEPWEGNTRFEDWQAGAGAGAGTDAGGWATARGGGAPGAANYPMGLVDYQDPTAMSGIPLDFQPWLQPGHIPDSLWNYQAPTLNEWEVERDWDWATKPASEYLTDEQKAAKAVAAAQIRGDRETEAYRNPFPGLIDPTWGQYSVNPYESPEYSQQAQIDMAAAMAKLGVPQAIDFGIGTKAGVDMGEIGPTTGPTVSIGIGGGPVTQGESGLFW